MEVVFKSIEEIHTYLKQKEIPNSSNLAINIFRKYGPVKKSKIKEMLDDHLLFGSSAIKEKTVKSVSTNIYGDDLYKSLTFAAQRVRQEIFGSPNVPFKTYDEAILWIEKIQSEYYNEDIVFKCKLFDEKFKEMCTKLKNGEIIGNISKPFLVLPYKLETIDNMECIVTATFEHSKELRKLQSESESLALISGFSQYNIVKFILSGEKPEFVRYEIRKKYGHRKSIEIIINSSDLTFEEIKEIYHLYRKELNVKNKKRFSERQEKLLNLINEIGPQQNDEGFIDYYTKVQNEFNTRYPEETKYKTHQAVYKAYESIKAKLKEM